MNSKHRVVYTVGSSNREAREFAELLNTYSIKQVVDVRRFPKSRFAHFEQDNLRNLLSHQEIDYTFLGEQLGGYRKGGYKAFAATEGFLRTIEELEDLASTSVTTIMCAERLPWRCHRRFIAAELERRGWKVVHIIDEQRTWTPKTPRAGEPRSD